MSRSEAVRALSIPTASFIFPRTLLFFLVHLELLRVFPRPDPRPEKQESETMLGTFSFALASISRDGLRLIKDEARNPQSHRAKHGTVSPGSRALRKSGLRTDFVFSRGRPSDRRGPGTVFQGPQCAFEASMFMCPAVHMSTRS